MSAYDLRKTGKTFVATSRYFDNCVGTGSTSGSAIHNMERAIAYVRDNDEEVWQKGIAIQVKEIEARGETPAGVWNDNK